LRSATPGRCSPPATTSAATRRRRTIRPPASRSTCSSPAWRCGPPFLRGAKRAPNGQIVPDPQNQKVTITRPRLKFRLAQGSANGRSVFGRHVDLPRGQSHELVRDRKRTYKLNGQESEAQATIGTFRVVHADDLRDVFDRERDLQSTRQGLRHLQESGLLERIPLESRDRDVVVLTGLGRDVLEANRLERDREPRQSFYAGLRKPRELTHDAQVYRAYLITRSAPVDFRAFLLRHMAGRLATNRASRDGEAQPLVHLQRIGVLNVQHPAGLIGFRLG